MMASTGARCFSEISEGWKWVKSNWKDICIQEAQAPFCRTFVNKFDEKGQLRVRTDAFDKEGNQLKRSTLFSYIQDRKTGELYIDEDKATVALKCAAVALLVPLHTLETEIKHGVRTFLLIATVGLCAIKRIAEQSYRHRFKEMRMTCWHAITDIGSILSTALWNVVSTPCYAIGVQWVGVYGVIHPYQGRKWIAYIERAWQKHLPCLKSLHRWEPFVWEDPCAVLWMDNKKAPLPYLANCFQPRGNISDKRIQVIRSEALG